MVEYFNDVLPIIINILLVILLVLLIIISLKTIKTMDKIKMIVDDVDDKVQTLNGAFDLIDRVVDKLSTMSDKMIDSIASFIQRVFKKKEKIKEEEENE